MDDNAITKMVTQYMAAWNEPDDTARDALLEAMLERRRHLSRSERLAGRA